MTSNAFDPFGARANLELAGRLATVFRLAALDDGSGNIQRLPYSIRVLLESALRNCDGEIVTEDDVRALASWSKDDVGTREIPFCPARVLMQDFTGVPAVVDLAALRSAMSAMGGDPTRINPLIPVDLVIDHSVQVDVAGRAGADDENLAIEFARNSERYKFLRWGGQTFSDFRVVPPSMGIIHQVNLEFLAPVLQMRERDGELRAYPDSLVGTDSHTTMINGLGVVGWGVGGIEAEATMLGQPLFMVMPEVIGMKLRGELPAGATATDLVLTLTEILRAAKVVGKFVEFFGPGLQSLSLADRATLANMAPEYGATMGFFPVDEETLNFMLGTGREQSLVDATREYFKLQGLLHEQSAPQPEYTRTLELDMGMVVPCIAGPRRPQDRISLTDSKAAFETALSDVFKVTNRGAEASLDLDGRTATIGHGSVVIAAITSCTNTSNPSVMVGAGLLARNAVERGLEVPVHVKTSLAPGSRVVTRYLERGGLLPPLEQLGFHVVGYGCTTCIGNSGPLPEQMVAAITDNELVATSVLSGNRNFEGRISPHVKANYLASPPLVVAYALAGRMDIDLGQEPLGSDKDGNPVFLRDLWPAREEVDRCIAQALGAELYSQEYGQVFEGNETWNAVPVSGGEIYAWDEESTYIREPDFFRDLGPEVPKVAPITEARVLMHLGDSVTTDHISPASVIPADGPAGSYLQEHGVKPADFNSFGSRRGNHEVMMRGTFANIRIRNLLAPGTEGGWSRHLPTNTVASVFDTAMRYREEGTPLLVIAGKEYGTGSSRDWAAKGTHLLGIKAVIAQSYERIHRSNLIGMGVLPLPDQRPRRRPEPAPEADRRGAQGRWKQELVPGALSHRFPGRGDLLQERRHPAHRAEAAGALESPALHGYG
jgi:aconitate hydratase